MPHLSAVDPTLPVAPYLGGKRNLARTIIPMIEAIAHITYAEPFVGMGGVFFRRTSRPRAEVINDAGRDVANLFRILQRHYVQFLEVLRFGLTTRAEFERLVRIDPATLTDLERAARFLYLQRTAFGGRPSGRNFGVSRATPARFNLTTLEPMLEDVHARLSGVVIEALDFEDFIRRYDAPQTLFYLDPPYYGSEGDYGKELFARSDFRRLVEVLKQLQGRFILSINDRPETRALFAPFDLTEVKTTYSIAKGGASRGKVGELIVQGHVKGEIIQPVNGR